VAEKYFFLLQKLTVCEAPVNVAVVQICSTHRDRVDVVVCGIYNRAKEKSYSRASLNCHDVVQCLKWSLWCSTAVDAVILILYV
jgi:hypothetical protein